MAIVERIKAPLHSHRQHPAVRLQAGQAQTLRFEVVERDRLTAVDLTGLTPRLVARTDFQDPTLLLDIDGAITSALDGECEVVVPGASLPDRAAIQVELVVEDRSGPTVIRFAQVRFEFRVLGGLI